MPLPDLLQWIGGSRKTGKVTLSQGTVTKTLFVDGGLVVGSGSNDPSDYLGQILLSFGRITEEQLRDALEARQQTSEYLGALLVRTGVLTELELTRTLTLKTEESIYSLFAWDRAQFDFDEGPLDPFPFPVALTVDEILLKGARRFDDMKRIRDIIPSELAVPRRTDEPLPPEVVSSAILRSIAEAVDGIRTIAGIALQSHTSTYLVSKFLYEGIRAGLIEIYSPPKPEPRHVSAGLHEAAQRLYEAGDYAGVLTLIDPEGLDPEDPLRALVLQSEEKFVEEAFHTSLRPERIPTLLKPTSELLGERLSPEEFFLLTRIDGVWDIGSIISVSPMREVDALKVLVRLQKRGFIAVKDPAPATAPTQARNR